MTEETVQDAEGIEQQLFTFENNFDLTFHKIQPE